MSRAVVLRTVIACLALVGCARGTIDGPISVPPTGLDAIAMVPYARRYAAIVAPVDAATDTFASASRSLATGASVDDFILTVRPLALAVDDVDNKVRQVAWPPAAVRDINAQLDADKSLKTDLVGTLDVTLILSLWRDQILGAARQASRARQKVRIDLGLAPLGRGN